MYRKITIILLSLLLSNFLLSQEFKICKDYYIIPEQDKDIKAKSLENILKTDPHNIECMLKLASVYLRTGKVAEGFDLITKAYELNPQLVRNAKISKILDLALRLSELKKSAKKSRDYKLWNKLGDIYFDIGIFKEALNAYKKSFELNSKQEKIEILIAVCYDNLDKVKKAKSILENILKNNPNSFYANYYYAKLLKNELSNPKWKIYMIKAKKILENGSISKQGINLESKEYLTQDIKKELMYGYE